MNVPKDAMLLRIYFGENDRHGQRPLYEAVVREAAMVSLHAITGRNFRFDPMAGPADRAKKVKAWRQWWEKAKDEYLGRA